MALIVIAKLFNNRLEKLRRQASLLGCLSNFVASEDPGFS